SPSKSLRMGRAARASEERRDEVGAALWEARLAAAGASRAEYRQATRQLPRGTAELLWRQQEAGSGVLLYLDFSSQIKKLKQELIDLKQQAQEKKISDLQAHYYAPKIKELEEKFQQNVRKIGQIQLKLKLIKEFHREKAAIEKELEDSMEISNRRHQEVVVRLERRFLKGKKLTALKLGHWNIVFNMKKPRKVVIKDLGFCFPLSRQLNSTGREVFKENVHLRSAFAYQLKETMGLKKIKQKLEEDKTLLLKEKETSEGLIQKKMLQINCQKAQIVDLQRKVKKLEMALCHMPRESVRETQKTQHQAVIENQASMMEIKKLQQLLEMKDQEMNRVKKLAQSILNERTEVEMFFLDALEHVKQEIIRSRKHCKKKAQAAYYRKMMEACAGKEEFPKIKTFRSNINSTNSVYLLCCWEKIQFEKVDISELTWEQKECVLRLLFAKMNGAGLITPGLKL
uniref:Basal body-orientation factor 1 n=1 Tax=Strix occidentalis caurina TaxID=311401 RepID=A0A8D0FGL2_STROC